MTVCIPEAGGVPGLSNQPPTWPEIAAITGNHVWARSAPSTSVPLGLDDPRWRGGLNIGFPDATGGTEGASFRAIYDDSGGQKSLYLSWWIKADSGDPSDDRIYVGFERASGLDPMIVEIIPFVSSTPQPGNVAAAITPFTTTTGVAQNWTENGGADPDWLASNTHVWIDAGGAWGVQMRVPIAAGSVNTHLDIADTFGFWFEMRVEPAVGMVIPHNYPRAAAATFWAGIPAALNVPAPATWEDFSMDPACAPSNVVRITTLDVGTQNTPPHEIQYTLPAASNSHVNTFEAKPENLTGASIGIGGVQAEFRIADWGSTISASGPWNPIPATGGTSNPASNAAAIPNGTKSNSITMQWQLSPAEVNEYETGVHRKHQCMLVTLTGAGLTFVPASVYRNMDFGEASTFERDAIISNVGMEMYPIAGSHRPSYILVEKLNMPAESRGEGPLRPNRVARGQEAPADGDAALAEAHKANATELDRLQSAEPTIRYHVYHDTGLTVADKDGKQDRVLAAGIPFGYFVRHSGPVQGWSDTIDGATQIGDRLYELKVPVEGTASIKTVVRARERGEIVGPEGCSAWIAKLIERLKKLFGG